jgi:hypothetical protein
VSALFGLFSTMLVVIWLVAGLVIYFLYGHRHAHAARLVSDDPTPELREALEGVRECGEKRSARDSTSRSSCSTCLRRFPRSIHRSLPTRSAHRVRVPGCRMKL